MQIVYLVMILVSYVCFSQSSTYTNQEIDKNTAPDTSSKQAVQETYKKESKSTFLGLQREDPTNAIICSIIPGGGQIYNRNYWKAGLLIGTGAALTANLIYNDNLLVETRELISSGEYSGTTLTRLEQIKEDYQDTRDRMGFFILVLYVASTVDAFVGAKLTQFDTDDQLSFYIDSDLSGLKAGFKLKL